MKLAIGFNMKMAIGFVLIASIAYGIWMMKKYFSYAWGYESQVESTVCSMVNRESLKTPSDCD